MTNWLPTTLPPVAVRHLTSLSLLLPILLLPVTLVGCQGSNSQDAGRLDLASLDLDLDSTTSEPLKRHLLNVEKSSLRLGFIKLTDCAPIVIAK